VQNDGTFDIAGVTPGEYLLYAMKNVETDSGLRPESGPKVPVKVADRSLNGLIAAALSQLELRGRIRLAEGDRQSTVPRVDIYFEGSDAPLWDMRHHANLKPDGTFSVSNLAPDRYAVRLVTRESDDLYLKSLLYNGQEVERASIDLTGGVVGELEPVLGAGVGRVKGTVLLPEGREQPSMEPGDELRVVLVPEKIPVDTRPIATDVDQSGHFSLPNLAPGTYRAFAATSYDPGLWENAEFVRQIASLGTVVELAEKGSAQVELKLLRASEVRLVEERIK